MCASRIRHRVTAALTRITPVHKVRLTENNTDYNLNNSDAPSNRRIPRDPTYPRLAYPHNVRIAGNDARYIPRDFKQSCARYLRSVPTILQLSPNRTPSPLSSPLRGSLCARWKVFIGGRTQRPVSLINGETHARKNARRFRPIN